MRKSGGLLPQRANIKTDSSQKKNLGFPEGGSMRLRIQNSRRSLSLRRYQKFHKILEILMKF